MVVTAHWIDEQWTLRAAILEFKRFPTPYTGDAVCAFLNDVIESWELSKDIRAITTDNAADMCNRLKKLRENLNGSHPGLYACHKSFHVWCIAHVINLAVKECMSVVHIQIGKIRAVINSIRPSVKRRDIFNDIRVELGDMSDLPCMDCETRWCSTFTMIKKAFSCRLVINAVVN